MHYFTFAEKDSTLYEVSSSMNSGLVQVILIITVQVAIKIVVKLMV